MGKADLCKVESEFFDENIERLTDEYEGEYVALVDEKIVAHDSDAKRAYDVAKRTCPGQVIYLAQVPSKEALVV